MSKLPGPGGELHIGSKPVQSIISAHTVPEPHYGCDVAAT
jgi:hypothetical protein